MAPLRYAAKFDPFLSLDCASHALQPGAIQGKEGIKFCPLATLEVLEGVGRTPQSARAEVDRVEGHATAAVEPGPDRRGRQVVEAEGEHGNCGTGAMHCRPLQSIRYIDG